MSKHNVSVSTTWVGLVVVLALATTLNTEVRAQDEAPAVNQEALDILRGATDYLNDLQLFSVEVRNFYEDLLPSGQRVDFEAVGSVTVNRPNMLRGERVNNEVDQILVFDGTTVTLYDPLNQVYASAAAPGTIEDMFLFANNSLGLYIPASDLLWHNVYELLVQDVTFATVVGKEVIGGATCDHLLFSRPGVDFQIWVADSGPPVPLKYVVTDTGTPELLGIVTIMTDWNVEPTVPDDYFTFVPPEEAREIPFLTLDIDSEPSH